MDVKLGIINKAEEFLGLELAVLGNFPTDSAGVNLAGLVNLANDNLKGVNIAGVANGAECSSYGVNIAGLFCITESKNYGVNVSGLANGAIELRGLNVTGFLNGSQNSRGVNIAGVANSSRVSSYGVNMAGLVNLSDDSRGLNIALINATGARFKSNEAEIGERYGLDLGVANGAKKLRGVQIGLYNVCGEDSVGVQIGLLNRREYAPWYAKLVPFFAIRR